MSNTRYEVECKEIANAWRREHPDFSSYGFVLVYAGEVSGGKQKSLVLKQFALAHELTAWTVLNL